MQAQIHREDGREKEGRVEDRAERRAGRGGGKGSKKGPAREQFWQAVNPPPSWCMCLCPRSRGEKEDPGPR